MVKGVMAKGGTRQRAGVYCSDGLPPFRSPNSILNSKDKEASADPPGRLKVGDYVNCERAMSGGTRFGGHMVQVSEVGVWGPTGDELVRMSLAIHV